MRQALYTLNWVLMIAMPFAFGHFITRRRGASWYLFAVGSATFIISQLLHIPFNHFLFKELSEWLEGLSPVLRLLIVAIMTGLSAAFFEEGARYLSYRYWAKDARSWGRGLMLGAGHGGAESIILGIIVAINMLFLWLFARGQLPQLVPDEQIPAVNDAIARMSLAPWYGTMLGAVERAFAIIIQIALSVLVLQVFIRGSLLWLLLAFIWHAVVNATAVVAAGAIPPLLVESVIGLFAVASLLVIFLLRTPESRYDEDEAAAPLAIETINISPTSDNIENSRYD